MQSWQQGHNGDDGNNSWQQNFNFAAQNGQFEQDQPWSQALADQNAFAGPIDPSDPAANFLPGAHPMLSGYQEGHGSFDLASQYPGQEPIDPAFSSLPPDLYSRQNKLDLAGDSLQHINHFQSHPNAHPQGFPSNDFASFEQHPQAGPQQQQPQHYNSAGPQYQQAPLLSQDGHQQGHAVPQQFSNIQPDFSQTPIQQTQTPPLQNQQPYTHGAAFTAPPQQNGQGTHYQAGSATPANYQQQASAYGQQAYATFHPALQQQADIHGQSALVPAPSHDSTPQPHQATLLEKPVASPAPEGPAKKRQRITKPAASSPIPEPVQSVNSPGEPIGKKVEELDSLVPPTPTPEDVQMLQKFQKRGKASQAKFPSIKGLPHLVCEETIKLPAPKSYDKLAPLVALPSRSGNPIVPELGYSIPCEIQGKFTSQYRPAFDKSGLDGRRLEAKPLLDDFDKSMRSLGKKRPKYTEYPHSFKEQLKSDEASKNKEKKAKKELEEERNKPGARSATRPSDPVEAVVWEVIGIVHIEDSISKTHTLVAGRVQQAGDFFIKLRTEMNHAKQELDQAVKDGESEAQIEQRKKEAEMRKEMLRRALDATIEHADDAILNNLAGHQKLVLSLVNVLISSIKAGDFSGQLPKVVLELFTHFPMTKKIAETTNFDTVRKRFADKGDDEVKDLVREISAKVKKTLKAAESDSSTGYTGTSAASRAKATSAKTPSNAASSKRGREEDAPAESRTVKKVAVESGGGGSLSKKLAQPKIQLQSASKVAGGKATSTSILGDKARSTTKPGSNDSSASSTDDKAKADAKKTAGKTEVAKIAPSKSESKPPAPKMGATPSSSALSGIASLLDSINAPRAETPPAPPKEIKGSETPETEEERAKRVRKESRRKLRVSWKPEAELVQVKVYEKEDEEDEGRDMNMIRDAADDKSEGMVLKQRANIEGDDDEDDEIPYQPWLEPTPTDFSPLSDEQRTKNFTTRGGSVAFATDEQGRIAQREQRELMAIYTDVDDIPPSPKSPPLESSQAPEEQKVGNIPQDPKFEELLLRWRDEQQLGIDGVLYSATQRLNAKPGRSSAIDSIFGRLQGAPNMAPSSSSQGLPAKSPSSGTETNVPLVMGMALAEQVLAWLRSEQARRWRDPDPVKAAPSRPYDYRDPASLAAGLAVDAAVRALAGKPYPATEPPDWLMRDEERVREWWIGHNKEAASREKRAEDERARQEAEAKAREWMAYYTAQQQQQQHQQQDYGPYMAILQQLNGGGQVQTVQPQAAGTAANQSSQMPDSQIQSLLAAMNQPQPAQGQSSNPAGYHPNDPAYQQLRMLTQMAQGQPQAPPAGEPDKGHDHDREWDRHDRDRHDRDRRHDRYDDYGRGHKDSKKKKPGPSTIHKPPNAALIGTKPCTFWQQGKCARGDKCTFRHD